MIPIKPIELTDEEKFWLEELNKIRNGVIIDGHFIEGFVYFAVQYRLVNGAYKQYTNAEFLIEAKEYMNIVKKFDFTLKDRTGQQYFAVKK